MRSLLDACCISWGLSILLHMNTQYDCIYYQTWGTIKHEGRYQQVGMVIYNLSDTEYKILFITRSPP
jgi:hypothetical protein